MFHTVLYVIFKKESIRIQHSDMQIICIHIQSLTNLLL